MTETVLESPKTDPVQPQRLQLQGFALLILVVTGYLCYASFSRATQHQRAVSDTTLPLLESLEQIRFSGLRMISSVSEYGLINSFSSHADTAQMSYELALIDQGQTLFKHHLDIYRRLITPTSPEERPGAMRLFYEGNLLRRNCENLLRGLQALRDKQGLSELKEQLEASEERFLELSNQLIEQEREKLRGLNHGISQSLGSGFTSLTAGALLLLLVNLLQLRLRRTPRSA